MNKLAQRYKNQIEKTAYKKYRSRELLYFKKKYFLLSPKQKQILDYISEGLKISKVAEILGVKNGTIQTHLNIIYKKYGVYKQADIHPMIYVVSHYTKEKYQHKINLLKIKLL